MPFGHPRAAVGIRRPCRSLDVYQSSPKAPEGSRRETVSRRETGCPKGTKGGGGFELMVTFAFGAYDSLFSASLIQLRPPKADTKKYREAVLKILTLKPTRALAYWFMDDGSGLAINQKRYYLFSTHSFPLGDQEILIKALSNRLRRQARSSLLSKRPMGASTLF